MKIESHKKSIKESFEEIEAGINIGLEQRQKTIGFHCSSASVEMLEIYLHSKNLIDPGFQLKHNDFGSEKMASNKLSFGFENREEIIKMLVDIEKKRNVLCYGKQQPSKAIEEYIQIFNQIKDLLVKMGAQYE